MSKSGFSIALILSFCAPRLVAQVSLETLLSAPIHTSLIASPTGDRVAWVKNERGVRNVYCAESPEYSPRPLTPYTADDGLDISALEWTPDGTSLFYVRGNAPQVRAQHNHNPAHLPEGAAPVLWRIRIRDGALEKIGSGGAPRVSPDGKMLAFLRGGQVFLKNLQSDTAQARQAFVARGNQSSLRWSPDGAKLAFTSHRGQYSFIGIFDLAARDYRFIAPSVDADSEPVWSPDGRSVAFLRQRRDVEPDVIFFPNPTNPPWSIMTAEVASPGADIAAKTLFTAHEGDGSAYWNHNGSDGQLLWMHNGKIAFVWEKTGRLQLYSVAPDGSIDTLTRGAFEVDEVIQSADRRLLFFNSNQGDIDRKHLWMLDSESEASMGREWSSPMQLTRGTGVEFGASSAGAGALFLLQSGGRTPVQVQRLERPREKGKPWTMTAVTRLSADFPEKLLVEPTHLELKASDGFTFYNQLFLPQNLQNNRSRPALIFVHGGSRRQMLLGYHPSWYYANAYHLSQYFAARGYVVINLNYRSGIGYGLHFREAEEYGASGNSEFKDLVAAGEWLRAHPAVDPKKITVWGGSYGGYMTAMALSRRSDLFAAGVDMHGVHNWNTELPTFVPGYDSLHYPQHSPIAYRSSPVYYTDGWRSPVLFIHGDDDQNVPFSETVHIQRVLRRKGVEFESLVIPDEVHGFLRYESWLRAYSAIADFFRRKVE